MKDILNFLIEVGKLKGKERRGWVMHGIKNAETTAEHIFHLIILVWVLGRKNKLNVDRAIKMALIHDLCEVYAPDLTPYDPLLPKDKKKAMRVLKKWPNFTLALKKEKERKKNKMEEEALCRLILKLPRELSVEARSLWHEFSRGLSKEARFVRQADKMINMLQGLTYWKKYRKIQYKLWIRWIKEIIDDPVLVEFISELENKFIK